MKPVNPITSADPSEISERPSGYRETVDSALTMIASLSEQENSDATQILAKISARCLERRTDVVKGVLFQDDVVAALAFLETNGEDSELRLICGLSYWVVDELRTNAEDQLHRSSEPAAGLARQLITAQRNGSTLTGLEDVQEAPYVCVVLGDAYLFGIGVSWNLQRALKHYLGALDSAPILVARRLAVTYTALGDRNRAQQFWTYIDNAWPSDTSCSSETSTNSTSL